MGIHFPVKAEAFVPLVMRVRCVLQQLVRKSQMLKLEQSVSSSILVILLMYIHISIFLQQNAQKTRIQKFQVAQETVEKVEKASFNWSKLIARIYEVNPLVCSACGKEIKIISFVTHSAQIWCILKGLGWPTDLPEFDPEHEIITWSICQLVPGSGDGFPDMVSQEYYETVPDPPLQGFIELDSPHWEQSCDPPFWED